MKAGATLPGRSAGTLAAFDRTSNSGHLLYLLFAASVVFSHAFVIGGFDQTPRFAWSNWSTSFGSVGVTGFFTLGGFLIASSVSGRRQPLRFIWLRCARLLPLFWVSLLGIAFVIAPLSVIWRNGDLSSYPWTGTGGGLSYVASNAFVMVRQWGIGSTLHDAPVADAWNGSMWTLIAQMACYVLLVPLIALGVSTGRRWLAILAAVCCWLGMAVQESGLMELPKWDRFGSVFVLVDSDRLHLMYLFFLGFSLYLYRAHVRTGQVATLAMLGIISLSFVRQEWHYYGSTAWAVLALILLTKLKFRLTGPLAGVAFGIYVWAFPVEQFGVAVGVPRAGYFPYALMSFCIAGLLAIAGHRVVEVPLVAVAGRFADRVHRKRAERVQRRVQHRRRLEVDPKKRIVEEPAGPSADPMSEAPGFVPLPSAATPGDPHLSQDSGPLASHEGTRPRAADGSAASAR